MRVIAGTAKGRRLRVPPGLRVRPSGARLRESAFGILEHRGAIDGARVLDLFAGTGALGIEALSRGARELVAVEHDRDVARVLEANLRQTDLADRARVMVEPVERALARLAAEAPFDLVLVDPPYRSGLAERALEALVAHGIVAADGLILVEHARTERLTWPNALARELERPCGDSTLTLLRATARRDDRPEVPAHAHP
ncbi:MAG: 16S rRNA (guanine(966)-N(2))-methyltransferase RsmD [Thermodesulfobacteriota bacterium]